MPQDNIFLLSDVHVSNAPNADGKTMPRKFSGVANSGKPFNHYGEMCIVDLTDISFKDAVPALLLHDRAQRAGFGVLSVANNQLLIDGTLLDNEHGRAVADDADAGFPWQMSAHVNPASIHELGDNATATINGHDIKGPITILKNCSISEISFTPTGVDSETSAAVLADSGATQSKIQKDNSMTLEEALAKIAENEKTIAQKDEKIKSLEEENKQLKAEKETAEAEAHEAAVDAQLSQAGFTKSEDGTWQGISNATHTMLLSSDIKTASGVIADLAPKNKADAPDYLFGEQHKPSDVGNDKHLSDSPLVADAMARGQQTQSYI